MNAQQQMLCKYALTVLHEIGAGLPKKPWFDQVERMACRPLTTAEREAILYDLLAREWVTTRRNPLTDEILYCIGPSGNDAMIGL